MASFHSMRNQKVCSGLLLLLVVVGGWVGRGGGGYSFVSHTEFKLSQESSSRGAAAKTKEEEEEEEEEEPEEDGLRSKLESKSISFHLMRWEGPPEMKLTTFSGFMSKWTMLILCKKLTASTISERICTR
jgi:hypothetical protein